MGAGARTASWSSACCARSQRRSRAGRAHSAQVVGACRDLLAFPSQTAQVATSFPCHDLLEAILCHNITLVSRHRSAHSGRDTRTRSRPPGRPSLCRDIKFMLRPQFPTGLVATSVPCRDLLETNLCHDINLMSQHRFCPQWAFQVATPKSMSRPPTLSPMSRHRFCSTKTDQVAISLPCRDLTCCHPRRDIKPPLKASNPVTIPARSRRPFPGRDLMPNQTRSRPQEVLTH